MATHSSILAWEIPWTEEPDGLQAMVSREGRDLGVAFQAPPGSQASSRGEAKDSALLSSRDGYVLESTE